MLGRRLQQIGAGVICVGLMFVALRVSITFVALRVSITRTLLPSDLITCGLFMIAELYLLPLGVLLVLMGWRLRHSRRHSFLVRLPAYVLAALVAVAVYAVSYFAVRPPVGRLLEWGRYGAGPPVLLSRLEEVTAVTSLAFPPGSQLLDGEHLGGMNPYLFAKIALPRSEVQRFLAQSPFEGRVSDRDWGPFIWDLYSLCGRPWDMESIDHFLAAWGHPGDNSMEYVNVIVDLDDPDSATLYLVWYIQ